MYDNDTTADDRQVEWRPSNSIANYKKKSINTIQRIIYMLLTLY